MPSFASIKIGDILFRHAFPIYNFIYPIIKKRQDDFEIQLLQKQIKAGNVVLDIGANIGFYSQLFSEWVGEKGKVYSFEPDKVNFAHLKKNTSQLKNIVLHEAAVSDQNGVITLYLSDLLNVDHKTYSTSDSVSSYQVPSLRLDDYFQGQTIDFIKIDIQGYEYFAFRGLQDVLDRNHNLKILSEFYPYGIQNSGASILMFLEQFWSRGFRVFLVKNEKIALFEKTMVHEYEKLGRFDYFNVLIHR